VLKLRVGVNLSSLRQPFKTAIITAANLGAEAVEIDARNQLNISELSGTGIRHLRKMLNDLDLKVSSIQYPTRRGYDNLDELDRRVEGTKAALRVAYELGTNVVVNQVGRVPEDVNSIQWQTLIQVLSDLGNFSNRTGAFLAARTGTEPGADLKKLIDAVPIGSLGVDFDPGNLVINGFSPDEAMKALGEHVLHFRARDGVRDLAQGRGIQVQLGRGSVDLPNLLAMLEENQYAGFLTVDRESAENPVLECQQAIEYVKQLFM
jgi:sugar phosphate isomerase/epimerase